MKDKTLAGIFYTVVHDYSSNIVSDAVAEIKHGYKPGYLNQIWAIREWAEWKEFDSIKEKADLCLQEIVEKLECNPQKK